ncbi:MAG: class I SAM-dependent rRNA methyltransferase [Flavobacteriales bacterium]|nr:class I SAM-dependent rRNA methyltransferase [Flavobacteriales bacterium]
MKTVTLHKGKESSLLRRHRWVFSGAIARTSEQPKNGELVRVETGKSQFLGIGHYHNGSIAVRILTFKDETIGQDFWNKRLQDALGVRKSIGLPSSATNCFRLVHAEGDGLPGCVIDVYNDCAVVQSHTDGMANEVKQISVALENLKGLKLKTIYHRNLAQKQSEFLKGDEAEGISVENGLKFKVNWVEGQKTGFFLDQRDNRALVGQYAKGRNVLNTFCYTGGFSIYALANQAKKVVSVDVSQPAVDLAAENAEINGLSKNHEAVCEDAFKYLEQASGFDLVILDPPAFAKSIKARHRAVQGYKRLNETALKRIEPNGLLFTFSCSQVVSPELFEKTVLSAAINAGRNVRVLQRLGHAADHPVNIFHPEGEYLKGLLLHVS